jgi:hypothetical protein
MIGDHHGRTAGRATLLVRAADEILGTHRTVNDGQPAVLSADQRQVLGQTLADALRHRTPDGECTETRHKPGPALQGHKTRTPPGAARIAQIIPCGALDLPAHRTDLAGSERRTARTREPDRLEVLVAVAAPGPGNHESAGKRRSGRDRYLGMGAT